MTSVLSKNIFDLLNEDENQVAAAPAKKAAAPAPLKKDAAAKRSGAVEGTCSII